MVAPSFVALLASASLVAGHVIITDVVINGVHYPGTKSIITPENDASPVRGIPEFFVKYDNVGSTDVACSAAGYLGRKLTPEVPAGGQVGIRWGGEGGPDGRQWPYPEGPIVAYLASCNGNCSEFIPTTAQFFKIYEEGLDTSQKPNAAGNDHTPAGQGLWAQNRIQYEDSWSWVTIPEDIKAGEYLLRHELIALHGANNAEQGAEYYPGCIQIKVTGGGDASPATTPANKLYSYADGLVDIYSPAPGGIESYTIPGPPLYKSGGSSNPAPSSNEPASNNSDPTSVEEPATNQDDDLHFQRGKARRLP